MKKVIDASGEVSLVEETLTDGSRVYNLVLGNKVEIGLINRDFAVDLFKELTEGDYISYIKAI